MIVVRHYMYHVSRGIPQRATIRTRHTTVTSHERSDEFIFDIMCAICSNAWQSMPHTLKWQIPWRGTPYLNCPVPAPQHALHGLSRLPATAGGSSGRHLFTPMCRVIIPAPTCLSHAFSSAAVLWRPLAALPTGTGSEACLPACLPAAAAAAAASGTPVAPL